MCHFSRVPFFGGSKGKPSRGQPPTRGPSKKKHARSLRWHSAARSGPALTSMPRTVSGAAACTGRPAAGTLRRFSLRATWPGTSATPSKTPTPKHGTSGDQQKEPAQNTLFRVPCGPLGELEESRSKAECLVEHVQFCGLGLNKDPEAATDLWLANDCPFHTP